MMNTNILRKCLEELQKTDPRKDYVIGMLETLVEMDAPEMATKAYVDIIKPVLPKIDEILTDDDKEYARKMAGGKVGNLS